ncbi:SprT family zinc-dependent metalloprotease [Planosporangium thailandense]|uniref:SprT family zinc-dependent metalloprotease n=1 Tax=Planosporangium thailandense TaxID=765197 RepID=A0ABX0Y2I5_9ACTN|nr:SprT-like domain-containing protein [Planosporangium thailandense]NJC71645.1 SprT family zinc-dependent metalloprotease [Planosporangium thailandense]
MELDEARELAVGLMAEHGLSGWRLVFDEAKTRAGVCRPDTREIGLSRPLTRLYDREQVRDTVLHEIAHALVGTRHGHDRVWRATALRIGCSGTRCVSEEAPRLEGAWVGVCPAGHRSTAHRRPTRVKSCRHCSPIFDTAALLEWTYRGRPAPMHPSYVAELARLRGRAAVPAALRIGDRVRLTGGGKYGGMVGTIAKRGRTRYQVQTPLGVLSAPFTMVEATERDRVS